MMTQPQIHWYQPNKLLYWNLADLNSATDLILCNSVILQHLQNTAATEVTLITDWREVETDDLLVRGKNLRQYLTFTQQPNLKLLVACHAQAHDNLASIVQLAQGAQLAFRAVDTLNEAILLTSDAALS